ncbi:DnaJ-domain-containing protein [Fragilariopsis cylindrus CCMP1102]|uniref:DnaJ-domain-containing protein n=1 Tax=Fragilariopsis cylindrus CCMP1102 TaxID=635003 RepID=A0A1E7FEZ0_9STRA|nr:DnaJ-domain-containing protein [Fragilariopsis cylindrus CCMP1102]|eukprot:OEU16741.1 DnaJ-domain-containing protein [Fragilariopsis cylindrus CCMP1102]
MSEDAGAGSDDFSGLGGFFFYVFLVHPITAWILRPGRFERKKSIMYAIAFLAALAAVKTGLEIQQQGPNYYQILDVTRESNPLEIKRAYKKLGLKLHPDKNPSPDAADEFDRVKQAYDILMDLELRDVYNKFGKEGVRDNKRYSETQFLIEVAIFYVSWAVMAFLLTMGKKSGQARDWVFTGLIVMLVVEVVVMTSQDNPIPTWLLPTVTERDIVRIMHSLFPAFMNGCRSLGSFLFVDVDAQLRQFLLALQEQNKDILLVLRDVQIGVQNIQANGISGGGFGGGPLQSTGNIPVTTEGGIPTKATPTGKIRELQDRLQYSNATVAQAVQSLKTENKSSNLGFYGMIIGYIVISYLFG